MASHGGARGFGGESEGYREREASVRDAEPANELSRAAEVYESYKGVGTRRRDCPRTRRQSGAIPPKHKARSFSAFPVRTYPMEHIMDQVPATSIRKAPLTTPTDLGGNARTDIAASLTANAGRCLHLVSQDKELPLASLRAALSRLSSYAR